MSPYVIPLVSAAVLWLAIVLLNERFNLLSCDRFPSTGAKYFAYVWLGGFTVLLAYLVTSSALQPATVKQLSQAPFYTVFALHGILVVFLIGWWAATGRPPLRQFLNIQSERRGDAVLLGITVGVGGWVFTLAAAALAAILLQQMGFLPENPEPPAMIGWMANLALWKKALIVLSAMTVEEFFFRSWLQKRVGLLASTILFALAHFTYGQPMMLIGITIVSLVIGYTFYRTKDVVPGIIAHGVFDAIQLFVIVPLAVKLMGLG